MSDWYICGCGEFGSGPQNRRPFNGSMPKCLKCGALESERGRHGLLAALGQFKHLHCTKVEELLSRVASNDYILLDAPDGTRGALPWTPWTSSRRSSGAFLRRSVAHFYAVVDI